MKIIEASAHIVTSEGKNVSGVTLTLETFQISSRRWVKLAAVKTTSKGIWQAKITQLRAGAFYAPQLRLIEGGNTVPRVLAQNGFLSYVATTTTLFVDFGRVERLDRNAYLMQASSSRFKRSKLTVAGQPKKPVIFRAVNTSSRIPLVTQPVLSGAGSNATNTTLNAENSAISNRVVLDTFNAEVLKFTANEVQLNLQIIKKDQLLAAKLTEINTNKTRIQTLETQLNKAIESERKLKIDNQLFESEAKRKTPIQDIAANIGSEVDAANQLLRSKKQPYQFGRIELDLKGAVSPDGHTMTLINLGDLTKLKNGATPPGVKMELIPEREQTKASALVKIPNVIGLTETATRRLLQAVGLQLESISQSLADDSKIPVGQSIQQAPKAGKETARGSTILVVFTVENSNIEEQS